MTPTCKRQRGFTLIELMVALTVFAVAMVAVYKSVAGYVNNIHHLEQRTLAQWAAMNVMAELEVSNAWPGYGKTDGELRLAGREWFWRMEVAKIADERLENNMRIVELWVFADEEAEQPLTFVQKNIGRPM